MQLAAGLLAAGGPSTQPTNLGAGLLGGLQAYQSSIHGAANQRIAQQQAEMLKAEFDAKQQERAASKQAQQQMIDTIMQLDPSGRLMLQYRLDPKGVAERLFPKMMEFDKIDPSKYTPESLSAARKANDPTLLRPRTKVEVSNGLAYDPYATAPGTVMPNPNQPFTLGPDGKPVANVPYQQYEIARASAGGTKVNVPVSVNTERQFLGQIGDTIGKNVATTAEQAQASARTLDTVSKINQALDSGKVIAGPMTNPQIVLRQVGQIAGIGGKDNNETLQRTREVIQGLAALELDAAQAMKGQGQITEAERDIIRRAASGDINLTVPELRTLTGALDKVARSKIRANEMNVRRLERNPNAAPVVDFLRVPEPPAMRSLPAPTGLPPGWSVQEIR